MNVARDHHSNTIYFTLTEYGICQKCFCRCDSTEGRKFGLCRDYHSNMVALTAKLKSTLFPNAKSGEGGSTKSKYAPNDIQSDRKLLVQLLENKMNELQMLQDRLDGKAYFEQRFDKNSTKRGKK